MMSSIFDANPEELNMGDAEATHQDLLAHVEHAPSERHMSSAFVHTENHGSWFSTPDGRITLLAPSSPSNLTDGNYGLLKAGIGYSIQIPQEGREALFRSHQFSNTQDNPSALDRPAIRREPGKPASTEIVIINDDTSDSMSTLGTQSPSQACQGQPPEEPILIDLDDIEDKLNIEFPDEEEQVSRIGKPPFDQHGVGKPTRPRMLPPPPMRNPPITAPYIILDHYRHTTAANNIYHLGSSVLVELRHEEFLLIKHIIQNTKTGEIFLRGALLQRSRHMNGVLEHKLCELAFIYEIDLDDPRKAEEQGLVERPACSVLRKRPFHLTNQSWPEDRAVGRDGFKDQALDGIVGPVTVRWKHIIVYPDATSRTKNIRAHRALEHLKEDEIPGSAKIKDTRRRGQWRGLTIPGGSYLPKINNCSGRPIEIRSSSPDTTIDGELPGHRRTSLGRSRAPETIPLEVRMYAHKRKLHSTDFCKSSQERQYPYKRARYNSPDEGERGRRSSRVSMQSSDGDVRERISTMDISNDRPSTPDSLSHPAYDSEVSPRTIPGLKKFSNVTKEQERRVSFLQSDCSPTPSIDISSSELSMPPPFGDIKNTTETRQLICRTPGQKLTYGDAFCGAGGTTRGAVMAGFRVKWGFDEDSAPCGTWRVNFPNAACYQLHSSGFIALAKKNRNLDMKVDILHLSPPCQFFSSAHTVAGVKDEVNLASLFAVHDIIDVARPRIVTLEQTFGITVPKFRAYLNHLIQMFTSHHFSVRWAVVPLAQWGLPQSRRRLIIIAACPGEILPRIPFPTHGPPGSGLLPYSTVNETLHSIRADAPNNTECKMLTPHRKPWDGSRILPRAITCHGGLNYHPSGMRDFTLAEYAALQGFPPNHRFERPYVKRQIGNAVPPCVAKTLFESIKGELERVDGIDPSGEVEFVD